MKHTAFYGRVTFDLLFETQARVKKGLKLLNAAEERGLIEKGFDKGAFAEFALFLPHTASVEFKDVAEFPELSEFADFWTWYAQSDPDGDYLSDLVWRWSEQIGKNVMKEWAGAYKAEQNSAYTAPKELLPDHALSDEERTDPN